MKTTEFFPKLIINGSKVMLNTEALETMDLDNKGSKVIIIKASDPEKVKNKTEILIMKVNGSLCDDPENIKEVFNPELIREVNIEETEDGNVGSFIMPESSINIIKESIDSEKPEYKLLVCNAESSLGKEFREQFDIQGNYYRLANINDKRVSIGKEKGVKSAEEVIERVKINE